MRMKLTLQDPSYLKDSIAVISELVNEARFKISKNGIELVAMDPANVAMVIFKLLSSCFSEYKLDKDIDLAIDLNNLKQILRRAKPSDQLSLSIGEDGMLTVTLKSANTRTFSIPIIESDQKEQRIPDLEFPARIKMSANINAGMQYRSRRTAGPPELSAAIANITAATAAQTTAATAARTSLVTAAFAEGGSAADLRAKVEELRAAELALANGQAMAFANLQASPARLSANMVPQLYQTRRGGRGGAFAQWDMGGYQLDLDFGNSFTGMHYEQAGRGIVTRRGQIGILTPTGLKIIANIGDGNQTDWIKQGDWNTVHLIARGNVLTHIFNGHIMSITFDENPTARAFEGLLGLEIEANGDVWMKNVYLKNL